MKVPEAGPILVLDTWYDPAAGTGQTAMKLLAPVRARDLCAAAMHAAREEIRSSLPIEVDEPLTPIRMHRGRRLPDGARFVFVDWIVGYPSTRIIHSLERILMRAWAALQRKQTS